MFPKKTPICSIDPPQKCTELKLDQKYEPVWFSVCLTKVYLKYIKLFCDITTKRRDTNDV